MASAVGAGQSVRSQATLVVNSVVNSASATQSEGNAPGAAAHVDAEQGAEKRARGGRHKQGDTPKAAAVASAMRPRSLLKARGGYETPGAISASERKREERRRDSAKLQEISATYGVQVKDKTRRQSKREGAKQVKGPVS